MAEESRDVKLHRQDRQGREGKEKLHRQGRGGREGNEKLQREGNNNKEEQSQNPKVAKEPAKDGIRDPLRLDSDSKMCPNVVSSGSVS